MTSNAPTVTTIPPGEKNPALRILAHIISYVFHPLFITSYVMAFLIFLHPYAFVAFEHKGKVFRLINIIFCNAFLPIFSVFLLWRLGFIKSMHLRSEKERIIPYIIAMTFYWWTWNVFKNLPDSPPIAVHFLLGAFLALCGGWLCNIYFKVSMHAIGVGGALMFFILFSFHDAFASGLYLGLAVLATGLVGTARLINGDHTNFEIYSGIFIGLLGQYVGWMF